MLEKLMNPGSNLFWLRLRSLGVLVLLWIHLAAAPLRAQPTSARVEPPLVLAPLDSSTRLCIEATGSAGLRYQWQRNGVNLPGQTNACLEVDRVSIEDGGSYRATVSDAEGTLQSDEASLVVDLKLLPGADGFVDGTRVAAVSNSIRGVMFAATRELGEPVHSGLQTSNSVWYSWTAPASGIVTFDTRGSALDTVIAAYSGSDLAHLTELASDDDEGGFHTSLIRWNAEAGSLYHIAIDGVTAETGTYLCNWKLEVTADRLPVVSARPQGQTVLAGATARFSVTARPEPGLTFQWFHNGQSLPGETAPTLTRATVGNSSLGVYRVRVTNASGRSVITPPADLEIGPDPEVRSRDKIAQMPDIDSVFLAASARPRLMGLGSGGSFSLTAGTVINQRFFNAGTVDRCEPAHCGVPGGASRWFQLVAASDGICTVDTQGSDVDTVLALYLQNFSICTKLYEPLVDCNNDTLGVCEEILAPNGSPERTSRISFSAIAGTVYRAVVDSVGGVRGTNIQFNVRYETGESLSTNLVTLADNTNALLQIRGSSVTLVAAPHAPLSNGSYRWQVNGRTIAGVTGDRLRLPFLNYSDAGQYSVTWHMGTVATFLGAAGVSVVSPCLQEATGQPLTTERTFQLLGRAAGSVLLEASPTLNSASAWRMIGPIRASSQPTLWNVSTGSSLFYRTVRTAP